MREYEIKEVREQAEVAEDWQEQRTKMLRRKMWKYSTPVWTWQRGTSVKSSLKCSLRNCLEKDQDSDKDNPGMGIGFSGSMLSSSSIC
jgi:hypothetical protein